MVLNENLFIYICFWLIKLDLKAKHLQTQDNLLANQEAWSLLVQDQYQPLLHSANQRPSQHLVQEGLHLALQHHHLGHKRQEKPLHLEDQLGLHQQALLLIQTKILHLHLKLRLLLHQVIHAFSQLIAKILAFWILTIKAPSKICRRQHLNFLFIILFFRDYKSWHFMWIISLADDSHEMSRLFFLKKN